MVGILSKLKPLPSGAAKKSIPTKTISLKQAPRRAIVCKKTWILGGLFALLLLVVLVAMVMNMRQTRHNAVYQEITGHIQIHSQRLAKASQQTILGNEIAFAQLLDSRDQLNSHVTLLIQGGIYRNINIAPINEGRPAIILNEYQKKWLAEDKKINLILRSQNSLVRLTHGLNEINATNTQLLNLIDQLAARMERMGSLPNEVIAAEAMKVLARSVAKSINTVLPSEIPISEIITQLTNDRERFSIIVNALNQGSNGLQISSLKDVNALQILKQIQTLFRAIDEHINTFQQEIPEIITIKFAAQQLSQNSEIMLSAAGELEDALQEQNNSVISLFNTAIYAAGAMAILALFLFGKTIANNMRSQLLASEKEIESTQKAILRLLNDMEKLAEGNLTVRTVVTEGITGAIADSINYTIEELHTLVEGVNRATTQVVDASSQAQQVSSELLTAAQQQSQNIEETTIALLGMAESIGEVSETAAQSAKVAKQSLATAEKGTVAVRDSIAGMNEIRTYIQETSKRIKRLGESSQEIGEIIALISDITEQTNVLALNAAIQAASAGEAGRGFTVIAKEVQRLAEHSAEATKQIGVLIKTIQSDTQDTIAAMEKSTAGVAEGAKRSDAAGQALEEIEEVSKHLEQLVAGIFDNTHAQARAADKVVRNMEEILNITRQTTNGTLQNAESVKQITGFASKLKASVSNFKV